MAKMTKKEKEYELILAVRWKDGSKDQYSSFICMESDDIFKAQAAFDMSKQMFLGRDRKQEEITLRASLLRGQARIHQHPNWPCGLKPGGKQYSCGEAAKILITGE